MQFSEAKYVQGLRVDHTTTGRFVWNRVEETERGTNLGPSGAADTREEPLCCALPQVFRSEVQGQALNEGCKGGAVSCGGVGMWREDDLRDFRVIQNVQLNLDHRCQVL